MRTKGEADHNAEQAPSHSQPPREGDCIGRSEGGEAKQIIHGRFAPVNRTLKVKDQAVGTAFGFVTPLSEKYFDLQRQTTAKHYIIRRFDSGFLLSWATLAVEAKNDSDTARRSLSSWELRLGHKRDWRERVTALKLVNSKTAAEISAIWTIIGRESTISHKLGRVEGGARPNQSELQIIEPGQADWELKVPHLSQDPRSDRECMKTLRQISTQANEESSLVGFTS
ncbi:uncharacterized protein CIMG_06721 [Coccidioides immitis RS]|uniref:Uncharacterized protein n=1 Tax=Coccidioides immitis (strain RS) TaxID=246410 RepID=J3K8R8_COCIM|nr:uncharacterized protein CIMG_06721 [Coccidioides immitis RS]EAS31242.3 hypothetical protein CIMG_06721 [Coccidioides immitis RS]